MIELIKLFISLISSAKGFSLQSAIVKILTKLSPSIAKKSSLNDKEAKSIGKSLVSDLKSLRSEINKVINLLTRQLARNPIKALATLDKKLSQNDKNTLSNLLSANNEGTQVFLSSSWIQWAIWVPIEDGSNLGTLTLKLRTRSGTNPSGIYTFPLRGHPHGYGNYVDRYVYEMLRFSQSAGTTFWDIFYRSWYNTHRGIGYRQLSHKKRK